MRPVFVGLIICLLQSLILIHNIFNLMNFEPESEYRNESDNNTEIVCNLYNIY